MLKILVPVDLADDAINAAQYAFALAAAAPQAQLLLLHCYQDYLADADVDAFAPADLPPSEEVTARVLYRNVNEAEERLEELFQQLRAEALAVNAHLHLERAFIHGLPEDVIPDEVQRFKPDLVVMRTKGESNMARSFFGTVTTKVIEHLDTPVLTVPASYAGTPPAKVAYATNFEQTDAKTISRMAQLLAHLNPDLYCVHVGKGKDQLMLLQEQVKQQTTGESITYTLLDGSNVPEALQTYARQQQVNLLALTTHKRSLFGSILHPSLTQKLVLASEVPLLVFHSNGKN